MATSVNPSNPKISENSTISAIIRWIRSIISYDPGTIPNYFNSDAYRRQQIRKQAQERIRRIRHQYYRQW